MGVNQPKIAIGFVIYKPGGSFYERLELINNAGVPFYVFDNSSEISAANLKSKFFSCGRYLSSGKNEGLGVGLSEICQGAYQEGFDGLLFFDQDTKFNLETISFIQNFMIHSIDHILESYSTISFSNTNASDINMQNNQLILSVDFAINSGSLFILKNLKKLGWHNRSYFVDGVDYEFCLRSHIAGFKVGKCFNAPFFDHESEQPDQVVTIFESRLLIRKYSYLRIKDSMHSYARLIFQALASGKWIIAAKIIRSSLIYIAGQILSRLIWKNK